MASDRELDVIVYGATGFVGRLTAEYLAQHAPEGTTIGLAGRSAERLAAVRDELGDRARDWPLVVADSSDGEALAALAGRTRAVATTVGPYARYGMGLVEACARAGTHYADLTGEVLFMRKAIDRFHEVASASGARIVHACGFDSIPSDLGVWLLHDTARTQDTGVLDDTTLVVRRIRGGVSGGTIDSLRAQVEEMSSDKAARRLAADPYALSPDREAEPDLGDESDLRGLARIDGIGWVAPFVMASTNTRVVRRSNALQNWAYGRRFRYREVMGVGSGPLAPVKGAAVVGTLGGLFAGMSIGPTRKVLDRFLPKPGEGPDEEARRKGRFDIEIVGHVSNGGTLRVRVAAPGDPGYAATAVMLGESALCLALDQDRLPDQAGVLTPATAMGPVLIDRLRAAGHTYEAPGRG